MEMAWNFILAQVYEPCVKSQGKFVVKVGIRVRLALG